MSIRLSIALFGALGVLVSTCGLSAMDGNYELLMKPSVQSVEVGEKIEIAVRLTGGKLVELGPDALPDKPKPFEWSVAPEFWTSMDYEPKIPGIQKVGPFELEFQGRHLKTNAVFIEVLAAWAKTDERYEFRVFPKTVVVGQPVRIWFVQQYRKERGPFLDSPHNDLRNHDRTKWSARGGNGWKAGENIYIKESCWFEVPTSKVGTLTIEKKDLPDLPAELIMAPIEIEVTAAP